MNTRPWAVCTAPGICPSVATGRLRVTGGSWGRSEWALLLSGPQGQQCRALGVSDAGYACDIHALVATFDAKRPQGGATFLPELDRPVKAAAGDELPVGGKCQPPHTP